MQRFKFRQPNDTRQINLTNLNDYHLYLKQNPGIDNSSNLPYNNPPRSPINPVAYRMCGRVRHSVSSSPGSNAKLNGACFAEESLSLAPCNNSPVSSPFTPLGCQYDLYYPISPEPTSKPSTNLRVYKKLMGNRDLVKEASVDMAHHEYIAKNALACRSTNYTQFQGPKLQWHNTCGRRRVSLLTRDNGVGNGSVNLPDVSRTPKVKTYQIS